MLGGLALVLDSGFERVADVRERIDGLGHSGFVADCIGSVGGGVVFLGRDRRPRKVLDREQEHVRHRHDGLGLDLRNLGPGKELLCSKMLLVPRK